MIKKIKIHKKAIIVTSVILILGIVLLISFIVSNKFDYQKHKDKINEKVNNQNSEVKEEQSMENEKESSEEENKKEDEQTVDSNNNMQTKENTKNNSKNKSNSKSKDTNTSENKENNTEVNKEETKIKHICSDADSEYVSWKNNYLQKYNTSRLYDSFDQAYAAGEKISYYSYGFIVDKAPSRYSDDNCTKEVYILEIYVPSGICEGNQVVYVPNNVDIIGQQLTSVDYLKQIGYACEGKNL